MIISSNNLIHKHESNLNLIQSIAADTVEIADTAIELIITISVKDYAKCRRLEAARLTGRLSNENNYVTIVLIN